jgi:hypothetical protein
MPCVVIVRAIILCAGMLSIVMLCVVMLSVILISVLMLCVIMLSVTNLSAIMLSVCGQYKKLHSSKLSVILLEQYLKQKHHQLIKTRSAKTFQSVPILIKAGPLIIFCK